MISFQYPVSEGVLADLQRALQAPRLGPTTSGLPGAGWTREVSQATQTSVKIQQFCVLCFSLFFDQRSSSILEGEVVRVVFSLFMMKHTRETSFLVSLPTLEALPVPHAAFREGDVASSERVQGRWTPGAGWRTGWPSGCRAPAGRSWVGSRVRGGPCGCGERGAGCGAGSGRRHSKGFPDPPAPALKGWQCRPLSRVAEGMVDW